VMSHGGRRKKKAAGGAQNRKLSGMPDEMGEICVQPFIEWTCAKVRSPPREEHRTMEGCSRGRGGTAPRWSAHRGGRISCAVRGVCTVFTYGAVMTREADCA
jgi:hypothetical protein